MKVLIIENDLLWSVRLANTARALGHEAETVAEVGPDVSADVAIIGLNARGLDVAASIARLQSIGCYVVVHAGHKDRALLAQGEALGANRVATNGELAHKLGEIIASVPSR